MCWVPEGERDSSGGRREADRHGMKGKGGPWQDGREGPATFSNTLRGGCDLESN